MPVDYDRSRELAQSGVIGDDSGMGDWAKVGENLVRHTGGTIYLRAWIGGKAIRRSLGTSDLRIAKLGRDALLAKLRTVAESGSKNGERPRTLGDAVRIAEARTCQPHLKPRSLDYYHEIATTARKLLPVEIPAADWTATRAANWWRQTAPAMSPQRANNLLAMVRTLGEILVEAGIAASDPSAKLKRMRIRQKALQLPSRDQVEALIEHIRSTRKRSCEESAAYVAFLAFSGCRHGEAKALRWDDVGPSLLLVTGGEGGTKGGSVRRVPISDPLRAALDSLRSDQSEGLVFSIASPRRALGSACDAIGIPRLRIHDLRHFFATWAIESGVDIPTVSRWLGHKDGGALAMRVYGHLRDEHSIESAKKLSSTTKTDEQTTTTPPAIPAAGAADHLPEAED
jgi:integrase